MAFVLLDDGSSVLIGVEAVHEDEWDVDVVCSVEILDLSNGEIEEGHAISDLYDRLGTNATHGSTKTTVELDDSQLVKILNGIAVWKLVIVDHLLWRWWVDLGPVNGVALGLVVQVSSEESEKVVHFRLESFLLLRVFDAVSELIEGISHLAGGDIGRSILESLRDETFGQRRVLHDHFFGCTSIGRDVMRSLRCQDWRRVRLENGM